MSSHNDHDHQPTENKPVSFITPLILGLVTILIIVISVNACDRKKETCCEDGTTCETKCEDKHDAHHGAEAKEGHHEAAAVVGTSDSTAVAQDTTHTHTEEHTEAHH